MPNPFPAPNAGSDPLLTWLRPSAMMPFLAQGHDQEGSYGTRAQGFGI
jgi:hypothetical protein